MANKEYLLHCTRSPETILFPQYSRKPPARREKNTAALDILWLPTILSSSTQSAAPLKCTMPVPRCCCTAPKLPHSASSRGPSPAAHLGTSPIAGQHDTSLLVFCALSFIRCAHTGMGGRYEAVDKRRPNLSDHISPRYVLFQFFKLFDTTAHHRNTLGVGLHFACTAGKASKMAVRVGKQPFGKCRCPPCRPHPAKELVSLARRLSPRQRKFDQLRRFRPADQRIFFVQRGELRQFFTVQRKVK